MLAQVTFKVKQGRNKQEIQRLPTRDVVIIIPAENKDIKTIIEEARDTIIMNVYEDKIPHTDKRTKEEQKKEPLRFDLLSIEDQQPYEVKFLPSCMFIL